MRRRDKHPALIVLTTLFVFTISVLLIPGTSSQALITTPTASLSPSPTRTASPSPTRTQQAQNATSIDDGVQGTGLNQFNYSANGWQHCTNCGSGLYNGSKSTNGLAGSSVTLDFAGTQILFYGVKDSQSGKGAVSIDGSAETEIDFYAASEADNQLLWTSPTLAAGTHTFKLRVTGAKNTSSAGFAITLDRVDIPSGAVSSPSNCVSTAAPTFQPPTNTPASPGNSNATAAPTAANPCSAAIQPASTIQPTFVGTPIQPCTPVWTTSPSTGTLKAFYYTGQGFDGFVTSRTPDYPNYPDWYNATPALPAGVANPSGFSVQWKGQIVANWQTPGGEPYTFYIHSDDGVRLWINNQLLINDWVDKSANAVDQATITLYSGLYDFRLEYYENDGTSPASIVLKWASPCQTGGSTEDKAVVIDPFYLSSTIGIIDPIGVWRGSTQTFYLESHLGTGPADITAKMFFASSGDMPVAGDLDGDGRDSVGIFHYPDLHFKLVNDLIDTNTPDYDFSPPTFPDGGSVQAGDIPVAGRWGVTLIHDGVGIYRRSDQTFYLETQFGQGNWDFAMTYPELTASDIPIMGDWDGDGVSSPGFYRPSEFKFYLTNQEALNGGVATQFTVQITNAMNSNTTYYPLAGNWERPTGSDGVGVSASFSVPSTDTFTLKNNLTSNGTGTAIALSGGMAGDIPVSGLWPAIDDEFKTYGTSFRNVDVNVVNWTLPEETTILAAMRDTADALRRVKNSTEPLNGIFTRLMGTATTPIIFWRDKTPPTAPGTNPTPPLAACGADINAKTITCYNNRAGTAQYSRYSIVHSLGYIFNEQTFNSTIPNHKLSDTIQSGTITDCSGLTALGVVNNIWTRGERGWGTGPARKSASVPLSTDLQQFPEFVNMIINGQAVTINAAASKATADMFLNWVYRKLAGPPTTPETVRCSGDPVPGPSNWIGFLNKTWGFGSVPAPGTNDTTGKSGSERYAWMDDAITTIFTQHGW